jgi:ribosomal protein S5
MLSKSLNSTNKVNIAYATIEALRGLVPKDEWLNAKPAKKPEPYKGKGIKYADEVILRKAGKAGK